MKKHLKTILAAVLLVAVVFSFCACEFHSKNEKVATIGNTEIGSELYLMYLMQADNEFKSGVDEAISSANGTKISDTAKYYEQTLEGKTSEQWIADKTMTFIKEYAWTVETFTSLGLTLDNEQIQTVDSYVYTYWDYYGNSAQYESYGISKEAFRLYWEQLVKKEAIFNYYYDEGGKNEVSKDDIFKNIMDTYIQAETLSVSILDENNTKLTGEKLEAKKALAEDYVTRFNDGTATIGQLSKENSGEVTSSTTSAASSASGTSSVTSDSSANTTSSNSSEEKEIKTKYEDAKFHSEDDTDAEIYKKLKELIAKEDFVGYDKAAYYETDTAFVVYVVRDINSDKEYAMETYKVSTLHALKDTEFEKMMTDAMAALTVTTESSISRYTAETFLTEE